MRSVFVGAAQIVVQYIVQGKSHQFVIVWGLLGFVGRCFCIGVAVVAFVLGGQDLKPPFLVLTPPMIVLRLF